MKDYKKDLKKGIKLILIAMAIILFIILANVTASVNDAKIYLAFDVNGTISDSTTYGNNATSFNGTFTNYGKINGAYFYNGTQSALVPQSSSNTIAGLNEYSASVWVNATGDGGFYWFGNSGSENFGTGINGGKLYAFYYRGGTNCEITGVTSVSLNVPHHIVIIRKASQLNAWIDGVNVYNKTTSCVNTSHTAMGGNLVIAGSVSGIGLGRGMIDEFGFYNYSLSNAQVLELYNNGTGFNPYSVSGGTILPSYNVTVTKIPSDINNTLVGLITFNTSIINLTSNNSITNSSSVTLIYNVTTALNNGCAIFANQVCIDSGINHNISMTKINNTFFTTTLYEKDIFPAYYPFNESFIENNNNRSNYTTYLNHNIKFNILNFTTYTNPFLSIEFNAVNDSSNSLMIIYYCNSSYTTGNPILSSNCEVVQTVIPQTLLSYHSHNYSRHYVAGINVRNVTKTANSSIVFMNNLATQSDGYNFEYVLNSSYNNKSFNVGSANSWSSTPNIFDIHLHQFIATDSLKYYSIFYDGSGNSNNSILYTDYFDVTNQPPTSTTLKSPTPTNKTTISYYKNSSIHFEWFTSTDFENENISYSVYLQNLVNTYWIISNVSTINSTVVTNANIIPPGNYRAFIISSDPNGSSLGASETLNFCVNDYQKSVQPCIDNVKQIVYYDANYCDTFLDTVPLDNATYENCVTYVYNKTVYDDDKLILMILTLFLVIALVCAIFIHEIFFGLGALLVGLMLTTFIYYSYPTIVIIASVFFILVLSAMWILVRYNKRN